MRSYIKLIIFLVSIVLYSQSYADRAIKVPITWTWATQNNSWIIYFEHSTDFNISTSKNTFLKDDNEFSWMFFITEPTWEYCSFDFWDSNFDWYKAKLVFDSEKNVYKMTWYARCQNSWWLKFNPKGVINTNDNLLSDIYYDETSMSFDWFAWSDNIWWISFWNAKLDITPPKIDTSIFAADWRTSVSSIVSDNDNISKVKIENRYNDRLSTKYPNSSRFFVKNHYFSKAKEYDIRVYDKSGNITYWKLNVVANIPDMSKTSISNSLDYSRIADINNYHYYRVYLKDKYRNYVKNIDNIKNVKLEIWLENNVKLNQFDDNSDNAIVYEDWYFDWLDNISNTWKWSWWLWYYYYLRIKSYAPTNAWYSYSDNNLKINKLQAYVEDISDTSDLTIVDIWSTSDQWLSLLDYRSDKDIAFKPAIEISSVKKDGSEDVSNWEISPWVESNFTITTEKKSNQIDINFSNFYTKNYLNIENWAIKNQNIVYWVNSSSDLNVVWATYSCYSQNKQSGYYSTSNINCNSDNKSSLIKVKPDNISGDYSFSWIPTVLSSANEEWNKITYSSSIKYIFNTKTIAYKWLEVSSDSTDIKSVKVHWLANKNSQIDNITNQNVIEKVWNINKAKIKESILKKLYKSIKWMTNAQTINNITYYNSDIAIESWPENTDIIVVEWWDLSINWDILKENWKIKLIVVLKSQDNSWWNIYINKDVKNIASVLIAEKSVISWYKNPSNWIVTYYSDTKEAYKQLYIFWTIISSNTIGWSSDITDLKCPYWVKENGCDTIEKAKRYDFNHFRYYDWHSNSSSTWVPVWDESYPFIIKYDSETQLYLTKHFK